MAPLIIPLVLLIAYKVYQPVQFMGHIGERPFEVYKLERSHLYQLNARTGQRETQDRLLVGYWTEGADLEQVHDEARNLAAPFFAVADSQGLRHILLKPSRPALSRRFPIATFAYFVHYDKDTVTGYWVEEFRKGDAARAVQGPSIAVDDSLARVVVERICAGDSAAPDAMAPTAREGWTRIGVMRGELPASCPATQKLITIASDSFNGSWSRRLGYWTYTGHDSAWVGVWLSSEDGRRYVNTVAAFRYR